MHVDMFAEKSRSGTFEATWRMGKVPQPEPYLTLDFSKERDHFQFFVGFEELRLIKRAVDGAWAELFAVVQKKAIEAEAQAKEPSESITEAVAP